ncbi:MAG: transcription-repair coupling factor [Rhodothermaceae bacterium]|nr:transcription-repair coupling factor [Rhodothermaceae bacterium]MYG69309.1 transcription-repair coupling factor [Rhodothermaceae bacterium]MYJ45082.1 transcription-repair coupling factor [Rhodothermaceae bacterium]
MADNPLQRLSSRFFGVSSFQAFYTWCTQARGAQVCLLRDAPGSLPAFLLQHAWKSGRSLACILPESEDARLLHGDLTELGLPSLLFPPFGSTPYDDEQVEDSAPMVRRHDVLQQLDMHEQTVVVAGLQAVLERMPAPEKTLAESVTVRVQDHTPPDQLVDLLAEKGFIPVSFVQEAGEFAWRGGIVDVFPFSGGLPLRLEFFGNELESIREFDAVSQRSVSRLSSARLVPQPIHASRGTPWVSLLDSITDDTLLVLFEEPRLKEIADAVWQDIHKRYKSKAQSGAECPVPESRYLTPDVFTRGYASKTQIHVHASDSSPETVIQVGARPQPSFGGHMDLVRSDLTEPGRKHTYIICDSSAQQKRLESLLDELQDSDQLTFVVASLHRGFSLPDIGLAVYTDHEIFGRYFRPRTRKASRTGGLRLQELQNLKPGDFVVHKEFGIGKFAGLKVITVKGRSQEAVRLIYARDDVVFVNVNALHKLSKYAGKDGQVPSLTRLGSGQWERTKRRAKKRIKDIARRLINLYAQRKSSEGYTFSPDSIWQKELEASFPWQDTPDQYEASEAVKRDMESATPMDRLVCGDVGFGKTEVAVRAAFKAVQDGKQVALLVPTTVLARQHYLTFRKRLEQFPVRVDVLSRRVKGAAARKLLADVSQGKVDVLVGTHRLVSKDVSFSDLGLLIIDEEQRFGVRIKEKLRELRVNVDTLTLTATPIPRTLQFSLIGARDLSIINTAPPNRQPIHTQIHSSDWALISDAILYEVNRGGQVFFIHNRVASIGDKLIKLQDLVPGVRFRIGHGQMPGAELEQVMTDFVDHKFDVLLCTSIVENGLDIANANTIIVDRAHLFGLAEIHQLRGRVGRSDRKAFCYLLVPSIHALSRDARQRLQAVEQFSDLGSGFHLAMRDLDIRGSGNILGGEQSGFIADLGLSTYYQMLDEAVRELRNEDFSELFKDVDLPLPEDTLVDLEVNASLPKPYVSNDLERLALYRRIGEATEQSALDELEAELRDRFGPLPIPASQLFLGARMRLIGQTLRLPRISYRNQRLFLRLPDSHEDQQFYLEQFDSFLGALDALPNQYVLKESKAGKMRAIVQDVPSVEAAYETLCQIAAEQTSPEPETGKNPTPVSV